MSLIDNVIDIVDPYMDSGGKRFVDRQITSHLGIEPDQLTPTHLPELAKWVEISAALRIDEGDAKALAAKVLAAKG